MMKTTEQSLPRSGAFRDSHFGQCVSSLRNRLKKHGAAHPEVPVEPHKVMKIATTALTPEPTFQQIIAILNGAELERSWRECLAAWEDSSPAQRADCRAFVVHLRDNFVRVLKDVDDPQEQETVAAIFYTQVKAQWILINTQSGYQLRSGRLEGSLFCRAGMLSALLGSMEPVLRKADLNRITNFLAEPNGNDHEVGSGGANVAALSSLIGAEVLSVEPPPNGSPSGRVTVDGQTLENRLRELSTRWEESEREWRELQDDLGVAARSEIVALFEKLRHVAAPDTGGDHEIAHAARAEWVERREMQLRALRKEVGTLQADWQQLRDESGATDTASLIRMWRETRAAVATLRDSFAREKVTLTAVRTEYGDEVTGAQIVNEVRRLSTELTESQARFAALRVESEYLEREFGTFNAEHMITLVRGLRDKITELSTATVVETAHREMLVDEFGTADVTAIIARVRETRDALAAVSREMVTLRADRHILQTELGKTDAREILAQIRALEKEIAGFQGMSELLGGMETALKTFNAG